MSSEKPIASIPEFVERALKEARDWSPVFPWFRGERDILDSTLLPQVFRKRHDENNLLQSFRRRAHLLNLPVIPPVDAIDQWLFLARHVGLPTRLLDWTEGALIALYFALSKVEEYERSKAHFETGKRPGAKAVVWMLHPMRLNWIAEMDYWVSVSLDASRAFEEPREGTANFFGLTWFDPGKASPGTLKVNAAHINIACAWELKTRGIVPPVAVEPTTIHPRMNAQHSYFTVHGLDERPLDKVLSDALERVRNAHKTTYTLNDLLRRFDVAIPPKEGMDELRTLGIADSTIMPDADSLAKELSRFMVEE